MTWFKRPKVNLDSVFVHSQITKQTQYVGIDKFALH